MKKLIFTLACVIGLMTLSSCDPKVVDDMVKQAPELEFVQGTGYITGSTNVYLGTELNFKVRVAPNAGSESALVHFDLSATDLDGHTLSYDPEITEPNEENIFEWSITPTKASTYTITATVTDAANKLNEKVIVVNVVEPVEAVHGVFAGTVNIQGHLKSNEIAGFQSYDKDYELKDVPTKIMLGTVSGNRVSATFEIEGYPVTLYGTLNGDITDGTINFTGISFNKTVDLYVEVTVVLAADITAVTDGDDITISGTASGAGSTTVAFALLQVDMTDCVINGTLTRQAE